MYWVYHMSRSRVRKTHTHDFIKERGKIRTQDRTIELEEFRLETFLNCSPATSHESNGLTNLGRSKQVLMRRVIEMDRGLARDIIKRVGMGGEEVEVKGGSLRGMAGEKGTLEKLGVVKKHVAKRSTLRSDN